MTLVIGCWEARGGFRAGPGLERKSDPSAFEDLPSIRLGRWVRFSVGN